jgi:hypothetical protein
MAPDGSKPFNNVFQSHADALKQVRRRAEERRTSQRVPLRNEEQEIQPAANAEPHCKVEEKVCLTIAGEIPPKADEPRSEARDETQRKSRMRKRRQSSKAKKVALPKPDEEAGRNNQDETRRKSRRRRRRRSFTTETKTSPYAAQEALRKATEDQAQRQPSKKKPLRRPAAYPEPKLLKQLMLHRELDGPICEFGGRFRDQIASVDSKIDRWLKTPHALHRISYWDQYIWNPLTV